MNDKGTWNKSWEGFRGKLLWVALLGCATIVIALIGAHWSGLADASDLPTVALISFVGVAFAALAVAFMRWVLSWRNFRRFLIGVACFATLAALFYTEEDWRGQHDWQSYKREREAKGERFALAQLAPAPVPDAQNFAMAPIWVNEMTAANGREIAKSWYGNKVAELSHTNAVPRLKMPVELPETSITNELQTWQTAHPTDLAAWQEYYRRLGVLTNFFPVPAQPKAPAEDVLLALSRYDSTIAALRRACERSYSRFPLTYSNENPTRILLPHLAVLKRCERTVQLRSIAELQSGRVDQAFADVELQFRLIDSIRGEPMLVSQLVRIALLQIVVQPVWEGLASHRWNDSQLASIEALLSKEDFLSDYRLGMEGERACRVGFIDWLSRQRRLAGDFSGASDDASQFQQRYGIDIRTALFHLVPLGWLQQDKVAVCRVFDEFLQPLVDEDKQLVSVKLAEEADLVCTNMQKNSDSWLMRLLVPDFGRVSERFAYAQTVADLARLGCALERYRLANGQYPETVDQLAPKFLEAIPHDIITGQPLKYRRTDGGQFVLYSVGWNQTDDGGRVELRKHSRHPDLERGDWVWRYPE